MGCVGYSKVTPVLVSFPPSRWGIKEGKAYFYSTLSTPLGLRLGLGLGEQLGLGIGLGLGYMRKVILKENMNRVS